MAPNLKEVMLSLRQHMTTPQRDPSMQKHDEAMMKLYTLSKFVDSIAGVSQKNMMTYDFEVSPKFGSSSSTIPVVF